MMFTERSAVVEAHRWDGTVECLQKLRKWQAGTADVPSGPNMVAARPERARAELEMGFVIEPGDWLMKMLDGSFLPAEHDWFTEVFQPLQGEQHADQ